MKKTKLLIISIIIVIIAIVCGLTYLYSGRSGYRNLGFAVYYSTQCSGLDVCIGPNTVTRVKDANPIFFNEVSNHISKDNKNVFYYSEKAMYINDVKSFRNISGEYYRDDNTIYYLDANNKGLNVVTNANLDSFEVLENNLYAKDKNNVYYVTGYGSIKILKDADPNSFRLIDTKNSKCNNPELVFSRDNEHVYYLDWMFPELSPQGFKIIDDYTCRSVKDNKSIYFYKNIEGKGMEWVLSNAVTSDYKVINYYYAKDNNHVYSTSSYTEVVGADPTDFTIIDGDIAKSKSNIYCHGELINGADVNTFEVLKTLNGGTSWFQKDKNHVYSQCKLLDGADPSSFHITGAAVGIGEDKNNLYRGSEVTQKQ